MIGPQAPDGDGRIARALRSLPIGVSRGGLRVGRRHVVVRRGLGSLAVLAFIGLVAGAGYVIGGHHDRLREEHGSLRDILARAAGFPIRDVMVSGNRDLTREEIFQASGIAPAASVLFLDVAAIRQRLAAVPLIAEVSVRKLYPDRIMIDVVEREAFALWQSEGELHVIAADGTVIDRFRDSRFMHLPHLVGPGANLRAREFVALVNTRPDFARRIRAGILVSDRRWTLKLTNGVDVKLPEHAPERALAELAELDRTAGVLAKDIIAVDLRVPGRALFRLSADAAAERRERLEKIIPKVRGRA
jgi:cell division protein FtsQ